MNAKEHIGAIAEPVYDVRTSIICQDNYCEKNGLPHFAPYDGVCYSCHKNIYSPRLIDGTDEYSGIPTYKAGCQLITGCPHCHYSFCE